MVYHVRARFRTSTAEEFRRTLLDGTIASQQPDGQEMVDSMNRAVVTASGDVEWSELCYCQPPLAHERQTVLDHYFDNITTAETAGYQELEGRPFMEYLNELGGAPADV